MLRVTRRVIAVLALIGLLIAPALPILAIDGGQPLGLFERILEWIGWSLDEETKALDTTQLDSNEESSPDLDTPAPVEERVGDETGSEMYPEWDPNG